MPANRLQNTMSIMMNRAQRRRAQRRVHIPTYAKQTHKLAPLTCVVWVPDVPGYAAFIDHGIFQVASHPEMAYQVSEGLAEALALAVRAIGFRAEVRPYRPHAHA